MEREPETNHPMEESRHTPAQVTPPPELPPASPRKAVLIIVLVVVLLAVSGAVSMLSRIRAGHALAKETDIDSVTTVAVVHPTAEKPDEELVLPASLQAYEESPIYARTNGYLLRWYKDIGSRVNKGELLAEIDTPEIDQELSQARATRQQIVAQLELAKISADRWENLRKTDSVSQQETDAQSSAYQQAKANLAAVRRQCPAPRAVRVVQTCVRAVLGRAGQAQRRSWRPDQRRVGGRGIIHPGKS